jgi:hypothetical protein
LPAHVRATTRLVPRRQSMIPRPCACGAIHESGSTNRDAGPATAFGVGPSLPAHVFFLGLGVKGAGGAMEPASHKQETQQGGRSRVANEPAHPCAQRTVPPKKINEPSHPMCARAATAVPSTPSPRAEDPSTSTHARAPGAWHARTQHARSTHAARTWRLANRRFPHLLRTSASPAYPLSKPLPTPTPTWRLAQLPEVSEDAVADCSLHGEDV